MTETNILDLDATALSAAIHARQVSCREVMLAYLARIHQLNPIFNAIVNLAPDEMLLKQADMCDTELEAGHSKGWLHGIPQAIKDTGHAIGFPTTFGSVLLKNQIATQDNLMTARIKAAGCIVIGKTNMPELGLGSHTFNSIFGSTCNAWDMNVSAGGSSGGAAVALAQHMLPVADGSDFMGSLRNPAAWNNIFGLRPSQGRVPFLPVADVWVDQLGTEGPMARSVRDLTALLATQAGSDPRAPLAIANAHGTFPKELSACKLSSLKVGWLGDLQGYLPMDEGLLDACQQGLARMAKDGAEILPVSIGMDPAAIWKTWLVWRSGLVGQKVANLRSLSKSANDIKPEAIWEYEQSQITSVADFMRASGLRSTFYLHMLKLFEKVDVIALPATQVWPFPIGERWPQVIAGRTMDTYHRWMEVTIFATLAGLPAISVPVGFHANGRWPAGMQLIGRPQGDADLLRIAAAYEQLIPDILSRRPDEPSATRAI